MTAPQRIELFSFLSRKLRRAGVETLHATSLQQHDLGMPRASSRGRCQIAIIVSTWYGGSRSGIVAVALSTLAIHYFFIPPRHQLWTAQLEDVLRLSIFLLVASTINRLTSNFRDSKQKIERLGQQLARENAEQLRLAMSAAQMGTWNWNIVTGDIKWSPEHEQLFGIASGTFDGRYKTFDACLHPDDRKRLNQALERSLRERLPYQHEFRVVWADGSIHWIEGRGHTFYDEAGQPVRMTGTVMAIDDRKQAQGLLQQQFEQQRLVMEITQRIRRSLNLQDILQTTVDEVRQFLQTDRAIVFQFSPGWGGTVVVESVGADWLAILPLQIYDPCIGEEYVEPFKQGLVTAKSDIYNSGISPCHVEFLANLQVRANLVVPILKGNELWGLLAAHHCAAPRQWQSSEIHLLQQLAAQVSVAIQQSALFEQVQTELRERKQVEAALQESQIQLQQQLAEIETIYQSAPIGLNILDTELRFVRINQRLAEINGFSVEAHIGRTVRELLPDLADAAEQLLRPILETGKEILNVEISGETPAQPGVQRTWLESFLPLKDGDRIIGISTVCEEITERKQAEEKLRQAKEELEIRVAERTAQLRQVNDRLLETLREQQHTQRILLEQAQLLDLAHDTIMTRDLNAVITFWNEGAESMYGWTKAEALGKEAHTFLQTQFPKPLAEIESELLARGYWEGTLIHTRRDGSTVTVASRWVMQKDEMGRPIKVLEINNDITLQKQAEAALQQYVREIEDLYNNAPCGYHSLDAEGILIRINDTELNWLGYTRDEILHKKFSDFLTAESQQVFQENFPKFKQQGWIHNLELEIVGNGTTRWVSLNSTAIKDEAGNFVMSRSTLFDISDRKRAEDERKQAELALRESEESRRLTLDLTHIGCWDWHLPSRTLIWNDNHFTILGLASYDSEPSYELWRSHIHSEDVSWVEQRFLESIENRSDYAAEYRVVHPDGSVHWLMARARATYDDSGQPLRSLGVLIDISDRKQAEAALQQQVKQEQLLLKITQAIRQSLDLNAILETTVAEVRQTLQVDRVAIYRFNPDWSGDFLAESVGTDWVKLVEPDSQKVWEDTYLQETQGGCFRNHETFVVSDIYTVGLQPCHIELLEQFQARAYAIAPIFSGEGLWGLLASYQNATPRHWQSWEVELLQQIASQLSIGIGQSELYGQLQIELHERKQAEAVLREAERRWRSLLDNVQLIVVGLDQLGNVNYVNPFYLTLTGYTDQEVLGKNWFENFLPRSTQQSIQTVFSEVLTHNAYPYYQNYILTKSGEERFIAWNNTMLQDSDGTIIIGEDITGRQKVEQMKNEFIGIISHELRTPLTAIKMSLGLLKTGIYDKKPDKFQRMLDIALIDTNRLANLVNDILDLERLESGRAVLEKTSCKAADLMQEAVDGVQVLATPQHITLTIAPTDAEVWAAADAIIQTLTNLLSNAIKFSPPDSTITLSAECQTNCVLFQVSDRGRGIPADKLETIFGRFQQVDASDARQKGGTGLGLAICRSIIEQHGGQIWAQSTLGAGSTFFFTLPLPPEGM